MFAHERHHRVVQLVGRRQRMRAEELQRELKISPATLRRDLAKLEQEGQIVRVHGGVMHPGFLRGEPSLEEKNRVALKEKQAIARRVSRDIQPGTTVFVDAGTTCLEAARLLIVRDDLTLITNSIPVLQLHRTAKARLVGLGGEIRSISGAMVGSVTLSWLQNLHAEVALIGASGLSPTGASTTELSETAVKQAFMAHADAVMLLADADKWDRPATFQFAPWGEVDRLYTSSALPAAEGTKLQRAGVEVVRAS
jgi:DeoR/GlpR family transcriptional regulator of sugar metabolism